MPLENAKPGTSGFGKNIATEINAGKDPKQAAAIAYSKAGEKNDADGEFKAGRYVKHNGTGQVGKVIESAGGKSLVVWNKGGERQTDNKFLSYVDSTRNDADASPSDELRKQIKEGSWRGQDGAKQKFAVEKSKRRDGSFSYVIFDTVRGNEVSNHKSEVQAQAACAKLNEAYYKSADAVRKDAADGNLYRVSYEELSEYDKPENKRIRGFKPERKTMEVRAKDIKSAMSKVADGPGNRAAVSAALIGASRNDAVRKDAEPKTTYKGCMITVSDEGFDGKTTEQWSWSWDGPNKKFGMGPSTVATKDAAIAAAKKDIDAKRVGVEAANDKAKRK